MIQLYVRLIKLGLKTIEDVPENLREQVQAALEE